MSDLPYLPLWVSDYEAKTNFLTMEQDGAYMRLLRLAWTCPGGTLPHDPAWVALRVRADPETFERVVKPVLAMFFKVKKGRWVNERLRAEFERALDKSSKRKEAGKKGGRSKSLKTNKTTPSNATVLLEQKPSNPEPHLYPYPELVGSVEGARSDFDFDQLQADCRTWANGTLNLTAPSAHDLSPIIRLLRPNGGEPCTLDDIRNGIQRGAASLRAKAGTVNTFAYFVQPIIRERDLRLTPLPAVEMTNVASASRNESRAFGSVSGREHRTGNLAAAAARLRVINQAQDQVSDRAGDVSDPWVAE